MKLLLEQEGAKGTLDHAITRSHDIFGFMAYLLNASCWMCGTEHQGLVFGSGFIQTTPFVPALEKATNQLACVALGDEEKYRYYTDAGMYERSEDEELMQWGELMLSPVNNYCPGCGEYAMDFIIVGEGD